MCFHSIPFGQYNLLFMDTLFLRYRKKLDYLKFQESSVSQSNIVEIFEAIHEIKLHQLEDKKYQNGSKLKRNYITYHFNDLILLIYKKLVGYSLIKLKML